jgi:minor extracellular serine protease Vpr
MDLTAPQARTYREQINRNRQTLQEKILAFPGAQLDGATDVVMNTVIARVRPEDYAAIRKLPGVKKIYISQPRRMLLDQAAVIQNAQGLWSRAGGQSKAGRGVKIGIIDSGIDITNPMFIDDSLTPPAGFPKGEPVYTNSKVIVARNYISLLSNTQRVQGATDEVGHGTFVAGVAAGKPVAAPLANISGMAPAAFLGSYKVFGTPGVNDTTTTAAILAALNDAVADGMDVINLSLGSLDYVPPSDDPEVAAIENAINAGVVVTISAGNDGPATHTISSPGAAPDAITVGSVTNSRAFLAALHITSSTSIPQNLNTIGYVPSADGPRVTSSMPYASLVDVGLLDGNGLGCSSLPSGSLSGRIGLVERGGCTFVAKVSNAAAAGGSAVVVYNNESQGLVSMSGLSTTTIPAVMISNSGGAALDQVLRANPGTFQVQIGNYQDVSAVPTVARFLSSFSSVGPGTDFSVKPDLVAVGESVYSAAESTSSSGILYDPSKFTVSQGTSFAAPMAAGAAAALRQLYPSLGALAIKSLLTSTASRQLTEDGTQVPDILRAGDGLLDMGSAAAAGAVFSPTSLNFGVHSYSDRLTMSATLSVQNISSQTDRFSIAVAPTVSGPAITFSQDNTGPLAPGATATIGITLQVTGPLSGGFQGFVAVQSSATGFAYKVPYWAGLYVPDSTRVLTVSQTGSGGATFKTLTDALAAARPGNIVEIEDSASYPAGSSGLVISTNSEGLPLHRITIRAAVGQTPTIDGSALTGTSSSPPPPVIQVVGLQGVLIQGLTINGGYTGIDLLQPSTAVPLSVSLDHCTVTNSSGDLFAVGVLVDGGGTVDITNSMINASSGTGILAGPYADGTQLTLVGTTVQGNGNDGVDVYGSNVDILDSTFTGNDGAELYLDSCTGTVEGNTFAQSRSFLYRGQTSHGDGIQIADGNLVLRNNTLDSNDEAGIALMSRSSTTLGPVVRLLKNKIRKNGYYGIYSSPSLSTLADGNLVEDNAGGVYLEGGSSGLFLNNIIARSSDAALGNGLEVAGASNARMVSNTVYQNALHGVVLTSGTLTIADSIVAGSGRGDVQGLGFGSVQASLIGDGGVKGAGITPGDPRFTNPASDDFTLAAGSPALGAGTTAVADFPFLDYEGRLRFASSAGASGVVDLGAEQTNSSYPLIVPLVANGNQPDLGGSFTTGIALLDPSTSAVRATLEAFNPDGSRLAGSSNPDLLTLNPEAQLPELAYQLFGFDAAAPSLGNALVTSDSDLAGFFLIFDPTFSRFSTGANASARTGNDLVFMRHELDAAGKATYAIHNPGPVPASVTATLYSSGGQSVGAAQTATVAPNGQWLTSFDGVTLSSGYVRVQSDHPISGVEVIGDGTVLSALAGAWPGSEARLIFPHYAVGGGFSTVVGIVNPGASEVNLTLTAYSDSGNVIGTTTQTLPAGGQLLQSVSDLFGLADGSLQTGYLVVQGDQPGIVGFTNFTFADADRKSTAAVPADSVPSRRLLFSHVAHGVNAGSGVPYQTGIALVNPFGSPVGYTISVYDGDGALVAQATDTLNPHQKVAKILSHQVPGAGYFTQALKLGRGHVEVTSDCGLLGFELFFTEDYSQLASVPAQVGN